MRFSRLIALLALAAAAVIAVLNQPLLMESHSVALPGGTYSIPLIAVLIGGAAAAIVLMLLAEAAAAAGWRAAESRLGHRLHERDREIVALRSGTYDDVDRKLDALRQEISDQLDALARLIEARLPGDTMIRQTTLPEDAGRSAAPRETVSRRP